MATICERSGRFRCVIRKKGKVMRATFSEKVIAEIWCKYFEDLIDNMENFSIRPEKLITLGQCWELKIEDYKSKHNDKRGLLDFELAKKEFEEHLDCPLDELTPEMLKHTSNRMLNSIVRKGGNKENNSGSYRISSPSTVLRKMRIASSVIGFMIEKGANITNPAQIVVNQIKMRMIKRGEKLEEYDE